MYKYIKTTLFVLVTHSLCITFVKHAHLANKSTIQDLKGDVLHRICG